MFYVYAIKSTTHNRIYVDPSLLAFIVLGFSFIASRLKRD